METLPLTRFQLSKPHSNFGEKNPQVHLIIIRESPKTTLLCITANGNLRLRVPKL